MKSKAKPKTKAKPKAPLRGSPITTHGLVRKRSISRKFTKESFLTAAKAAHKKADGTPKYSYDKFKYNGLTAKATITCPRHGDFSQAPRMHVGTDRNRGCPKCAGKMNPVVTTEIFLQRAKQAHGDLFLTNMQNMRVLLLRSQLLARFMESFGKCHIITRKESAAQNALVILSGPLKSLSSKLKNYIVTKKVFLPILMRMWIIMIAAPMSRSLVDNTVLFINGLPRI